MGMVKKFILEVKTVKTRKNTEWCENLSKSTPIWDQTVLSITQARNEIFKETYPTLKDSLGPKVIVDPKP